MLITVKKNLFKTVIHVGIIVLLTILFTLFTNSDHARASLPEQGYSNLYIDFSLGNFSPTLQQSINSFVEINLTKVTTLERDFTVTVQYNDENGVQHIRMVPSRVYRSNWSIPVEDKDIISLSVVKTNAYEWKIDFDESYSVSQSIQAVGEAVYSFPWTHNQNWAKTQGFHSNNIGYSLDFSPRDNASLNVLAIGNGTLSTLCYSPNDPYQAMVVVNHPDGARSGYLHVAKESVPSSLFNQNISKGTVIGSLYTGTVTYKPHPDCANLTGLRYSTACGCGYAIHLHFEANRLLNLQGYAMQAVSGSGNGTKFTADYNPPSTSSSLNGTLGEDGWFRTPVGVTINSIDDGVSGVNRIITSLDGGPWIDAYSASTTITVSTAGSHTVSFYAIDNAGNVGPINSSSFKIDLDYPSNPSLATSGCGALSGVWQNSCSDPNFSWSGATDQTSGVHGYEYYWGTDPNATSGAFTTLTAFDPPAPGPGVRYLRIRTKDRAGNYSSWQTLFEYRYDIDAPSGSLVINDGASVSYATLVRAGLSASDQLSGASEYRLRNSNGAWSDWKTLVREAQWITGAVTGQNQQVEVQYRDRAGNVSAIYNKTIYLDLYPERPSALLYILGKSTMGAAGVVSGSENYQMMGTLTQPSIIGSGETETLSSDWGYWTRVRFISQPWLTNFLPLVVR